MEVSGSPSHPSQFIPREETLGTHQIGFWVVLGYFGEEICFSSLPGMHVVQPVAYLF
jgi:hypothetical protein